MMLDQPPKRRLLSADVAQYALARMSEAQRLAVVFEIIGKVQDAHSVLQLTRIETLARSKACALTDAAFVQQETR